MIISINEFKSHLNESSNDIFFDVPTPDALQYPQALITFLDETKKQKCTVLYDNYDFVKYVVISIPDGPAVNVTKTLRILVSNGKMYFQKATAHGDLTPLKNIIPQSYIVTSDNKYDDTSTLERTKDNSYEIIPEELNNILATLNKCGKN